MIKKINILQNLIVIIMSLVITITLVLAWTEPGSNPPVGNVTLPINVSASSQYKAGALEIGGIFQVDTLLGILESGTNPTYYTRFQGGDQTTDITYTVPISSGSSGQVLSTNGSGALSWATLPPGGGSGWTDDGTVVRLTTITDKVGIGTANPSSKLHVSGDAYIEKDVARKLEVASLTDNNTYWTTSKDYTTATSFVFSVPGDRIVKRVYWQGQLGKATSYTTAYLRLVSDIDDETALGNEVSTTWSSGDMKTVIAFEPNLLSLGLNGDIKVNVQIRGSSSTGGSVNVFVKNQKIYAEYMLFGDYLKNISSYDNNTYSTTSEEYTTATSFVFSVPGDRIVKRVYWQGELKSDSPFCTPYLRLVSGIDDETALGNEVHAENWWDTKTIIAFEPSLLSLGLNGDIRVNVQIRTTRADLGSAFVRNQKLYVVYTNGAVDIFNLDN